MPEHVYNDHGVAIGEYAYIGFPCGPEYEWEAYASMVNDSCSSTGFANTDSECIDLIKYHANPKA